MSLLTASELSKQIGMKTHAVYMMAARGVIPSHKFGSRSVRFDLEEVLEATKKQAHGLGSAIYPRPVIPLRPVKHNHSLRRTSERATK